MKLFGYFRSSAAYRCRIGFAIKGITPDSEFVHLRMAEHLRAEYLLVNPQGLVPALDLDGRVLTQSLAILEWLDEVHPHPAFLPGSPEDRADIRAFAQAIACDIHPLQNLRVLNYLRDAMDQPPEAVTKWCRHWIATGLQSCEALLAARGGSGPFCFGAQATLADICLVPQMFNAERFGVDLGSYPRLRAAQAAAEDMPAFAQAHPGRQPDTEP